MLIGLFRWILTDLITRKICLQMPIVGSICDTGTIIGLILKPVHSCRGLLWLLQGEKRLSVTSKPDSLITNAAKDLLVYQSEPQALPFPSGDRSYYHEPVGPCDPDTLLAQPGHTRASIHRLCQCTHAHNLTLYTYIINIPRFTEGFF